VSTVRTTVGPSRMADHARQFPLEKGKGLFVKQRGRSFNWADLPPPGQDENRPTFARLKTGSGTGSRLDAESLGATFERARLAGLCNGGAPLALEDVGKGEIRRILKDNQMASSPRTTFLGVSPPVRGGLYGGAANPLSQDSNWRRCARMATASSLQALRERDLQGVSFLRSGCVGDSKLLMSSMEHDTCAGDSLDESESGFVGTESPSQPFACNATYFDL